MAGERAKYLTAVVLYGTIGTFLRFVDLPSEIVVLCRGAIGAAVVWLYLRLRGRRPDGQAIRANLRLLLLSGVFLGLNWVLLFEAYRHTTVAVASLCYYTAPILMILLAPPLLREKPDRRKLPCVFAALLGIVLVSGVQSGGGELSGVLLGLAAALCFAGVVFCNRALAGISAPDRCVMQLAVSALTVLPYALIKNAGAALPWDTRSVLIVLLLGVVHTGVAYCLYFSGIGSLPVQTVAILGYLDPVVSVLCSVLILREPLSPTGWLGAALILGAAVVSETIPPQKN